MAADNDSSSKEMKTDKVPKQDAPKKGYQAPGLRHAQSTSLFRAVNFELYVKPNTFTMLLGTAMFLGSVGYIMYLKLSSDKDVKKYNALDEDGKLVQRVRTSKWE